MLCKTKENVTKKHLRISFMHRKKSGDNKHVTTVIEHKNKITNKY